MNILLIILVVEVLVFGLLVGFLAGVSYEENESRQKMSVMRQDHIANLDGMVRSFTEAVMRIKEGDSNEH